MAAPLDRDKVESKIATLQKRLVTLHGKRDAGTRAIQYRIACTQLHILDLQIILADDDPAERASLHRSRQGVAADVNRLLKQQFKDQYISILDAFAKIEKATNRLRPLAERQR